MELFAKIENLGPFHIFWTLSCGDTRFPENFTCLLQDQEILYTKESAAISERMLSAYRVSPNRFRVFAGIDPLDPLIILNQT